MEVIDVQGTGVFSLRAVETNAVAAVEDATPFLGRHGNVDIRRFGQRKATQDRVPVLAAGAHFDVREIAAMAKSEEVAEQVHLPIRVRAARVLVDLLQHHHIRIVASDDVRDSERVVATVDAADALVDVVGEKSKAHVSRTVRSGYL